MWKAELGSGSGRPAGRGQRAIYGSEYLISDSSAGLSGHKVLTFIICRSPSVWERSRRALLSEGRHYCV